MSHPRKKIAVFRFPGKGSERMECVSWLLDVVAAFTNHPKYELLRPVPVQDTPITMVRNQAVKAAQAHGADFMVMVDDDMGPDYLLGTDPEAKPFLSSSLAFLEELGRPAIVAAPYCGPPPTEPVYVFEWAGPGTARADFRENLKMIERSSAAYRTGFEQVAALPTGVMLVDMRVFNELPPPYFYYEATDYTWTQKASTEDVAFSRDLSMIRVPLYCNWDAWAQHVKTIKVGKPLRGSVKIANDRIAEIVAAGYEFDDRLFAVEPFDPMWPAGLPRRVDPRPAHELMPVVPGAVRERLPLFDKPIVPEVYRDGGRKEAVEEADGADRRAG